PLATSLLVAAFALAACAAPSTDDASLDEGEALEEGETDTEDGDEADTDPSDTDPSDTDSIDADPTDAEPDEPPPPRVPPLQEGPCAELGESAYCIVDGEPGTQWCSGAAWGPCVVDPICRPGEVTIEDCNGFEGPEPTELPCVLQGGVPEWQPCPWTPLVLSFDGREPTFDAGAAAFELSDGSGACLAREWPGPDTPWLAIDLDRSGAIENGRELFGSASPMPDGRRPAHGFEALAAHDTDGDGRITPRDEAWDALVLWSDLDRDRASSPWELVPVAHAGLVAIELRHVVQTRCDDRGNCGVERSAFSHRDGTGTSVGTVIDVHIPCD
ncbi:MAG: calcium-binding protein, partial [Myxococcales bacterium]|nr:calcium-binding protein [Myxococcales bacterium]